MLTEHRKVSWAKRPLFSSSRTHLPYVYSQLTFHRHAPVIKASAIRCSQGRDRSKLEVAELRV